MTDQLPDHVKVSPVESEDGEVRYVMINALTGEAIMGQRYDFNRDHDATQDGVDLGTAETVLSDWLDIDEPTASAILSAMDVPS